jgi:hypothetical protein
VPRVDELGEQHGDRLHVAHTDALLGAERDLRVLRADVCVSRVCRRDGEHHREERELLRIAEACEYPNTGIQSTVQGARDEHFKSLLWLRFEGKAPSNRAIDPER